MINKPEKQQQQQDEKIDEIRDRHITELHNIIKVQSDYIEKLERELKMLRWNT